jgi:hypothetical protein
LKPQKNTTGRVTGQTHLRLAGRSVRRPADAVRWGWLHWLVGAVLLAMAVGDGHRLLAQDNTPEQISKEYKLRVAYLYNFSHYFDWPAEAFVTADEPFVIGVLGDDPFGDTLNKLTGKRFGKQRKIVVRRFSSWEQCDPCHMLYVSRSEQELPGAETGMRPLLIVSEFDAGKRLGSMVRFYRDSNGTIGFEIDLEAVERRSLEVDAKLLKLARVVNSSRS